MSTNRLRKTFSNLSGVFINTVNGAKQNSMDNGKIINNELNTWGSFLNVHVCPPLRMSLGLV